MAFKSSTTREIEKKLKQEKGTEMKTLKTKTLNFTKTTLPWLILFALVCAGTGYYFGNSNGKQEQKAINQEIAIQVASKTKQTH